MKLYQESTKYKPLSFFETLLNKEALAKYEASFYNYPINPSQTSSKAEGYIEYTLSEYEEGENPIRRVYFNDEFDKLLKLNVAITCRLLEEREVELLYQNIKTDVFLNRQLSLLETIKKQVNILFNYRVLILQHINIIEAYLNKLLTNNNRSDVRYVKHGAKYNSYFDLKVKPRVIDELYEIAVILNIIDQDIVAKDQFKNVFTSPILPNNESIVIFNSDNRRAIFFLNTIRPLFNNFSPSRIGASKSFFVKPKVSKAHKPLNVNDINKVNHYLRYNDVTKYSEILDIIRPLLSKAK